MAMHDIEVSFPEATAQVTAQVVRLCAEPRPAREIMSFLQLRHWKNFQENYLVPLMEDGVLERTVPDRPRSRLQKYRLTEKARSWLARWGSASEPDTPANPRRKKARKGS